MVVCISSNLDITLFFFKELDKTKYGQISVILLYSPTNIMVNQSFQTTSGVIMIQTEIE